MPFRYRASLLFLLAAVLPGCGRDGAGPSGPAGPPSRVVLITIDTLRADHVGCYGYPRDVTPFIDRLAAQGVRFTDAYATSSTTITCHASLFTSLYPPQHQLIRNGETLHESVYTMAQMFKDQGYTTGAFTTVSFIQALDRGFDVFDKEKKYFGSPHIFGKAMDWLRENKDTEKVFVWVHLFDVHEWYRPEKLHEHAKGEAAKRTTMSDAELVKYLTTEHGILRSTYPEDADILDAANRYDDQLTVVDRELEKFYEAFKTEGVDRGDTLWVVTTDHGEGLGSHDFKGHGAKIYNEQVQVPLIFHFSDGRHTGVVDRLVRHVDILPTLAEMLGTDLERQVFPVAGRSLWPLIEGQRDSETRYAYAQRRDADEGRIRGGWEPGLVISLQTLDHKYILKTEAEDEFYDLRADPTESNNLIHEESEVRDRMRDYLAELFAKMADQGGRIGRTDIDPKYVEELKDLGYIQ